MLTVQVTCRPDRYVAALVNYLAQIATFLHFHSQALYRINDPFVTELTFHVWGKVLWPHGLHIAVIFVANLSDGFNVLQRIKLTSLTISESEGNATLYSTGNLIRQFSNLFFHSTPFINII